MQGLTGNGAPASPDWAILLHQQQWSASPLLWLYLALAIACLNALWWLTRTQRAGWRNLWRSAGTALLATPAVLTCGGIAIMPLPVLLIRATLNADAISCGAWLVALPPNLMTFAGLWLVLFATLWCWHWFRRS